jgi:CRISPR-associated endonuclease/helicase Cas3
MALLHHTGAYRIPFPHHIPRTSAVEADAYSNFIVGKVRGSCRSYRIVPIITVHKIRMIVAMACYAQSANDIGHWHRLSSHLPAVSELAGASAAASTWGGKARLARLLHDPGRYGYLFQKRLSRDMSGLDRWLADAWVALDQRCAAAAMAIQEHHTGLQNLSLIHLERLDTTWLADHPQPFRLPAPDLNTLKSRSAIDGLEPPQAIQPLLDKSIGSSVTKMRDVSALFSTRVDADYLNIEAHFNGDVASKPYRPPGPKSQASLALQAVLTQIEQAQAGTTSSPDGQGVHRDLLKACLRSVERAPGNSRSPRQPAAVIL